MRRPIQISLLLILIVVSPVFGQKLNFDTRMKLAQQQMQNLEEGYLLVQLFERNKTKEIIRQQIGDAAVAEYEANQLKQHKKLMAAFESHYSFSKVAFFYSGDKEHIMAKDLASVTFYGFKHEKLNHDSLNIHKFLIGEVSRVEYDSITYYDSTGEFEIEKKAAHHYSAFIFRDDQFKQLMSPFPYYVRTFEGTPIFRRKENGLVKSIQSKLVRAKKRFT